MEKYELLKDEIGTLWNMRKVCLVPVVFGTFGMVTNGLEKHLDKLEAKIRLEVI